jgi:DNA-binding XRE family transcriptional regulator
LVNIQQFLKMNNQTADRLKFVHDFMKVAGLTNTKVAELMGISRQAVHHWFVMDDMKMSQIFRLFELCGYRVDFALVADFPKTSLPVDVHMCVANPDGPHRLAFLKKALDVHGISKDTLAERLSIRRTTIYNWFKTDDCFISYIYQTAQACNLRLTINISPNRHNPLGY